MAAVVAEEFLADEAATIYSCQEGERRTCQAVAPFGRNQPSSTSSTSGMPFGRRPDLIIDAWRRRRADRPLILQTRGG